MKKFYFIAVLILFVCFPGFSQDPVVTTRPIHKIPAENLKKSAGSADAKQLPREERSIYSCETSADKKKAVITTVSPAASSKDSPEIKEEKK